ncbi:MAG TPA: hypothetical protein DCZ94_03170 [Lentisphaeria bacterium]|nr:MAG: hypothetical protein A2X48_03440 [Lentisphaerae bacterium GWF2_49_21]HBC85935.1 hypothetical protein [Lentisphaeria bacterium]
MVFNDTMACETPVLHSAKNRIKSYTINYWHQCLTRSCRQDAGAPVESGHRSASGKKKSGTGVPHSKDCFAIIN